jgi:enolase
LIAGDFFNQNKWNDFQALLKDHWLELVGNDLTVTNVKRIQLAIDMNACDCLLRTVNQIGSVSEAIAIYAVTHGVCLNVLVNHRRGETEDLFIANLAVLASAPDRSKLTQNVVSNV